MGIYRDQEVNSSSALTLDVSHIILLVEVESKTFHLAHTIRRLITCWNSLYQCIFYFTLMFLTVITICNRLNQREGRMREDDTNESHVRTEELVATGKKNLADYTDNGIQLLQINV